MTNLHFIRRTSCPACEDTTIREVYRRSYQYPPLIRNLEQAYAAVGKIEYAYLKDAEFALAQCAKCQLVFQIEIPDDFLMTKLYEEWIDPQITFRQHIEENSAAYYNRVGSEVAALISIFHRSPHSLKFLDFGMGWGEWLRLARAFGVQAYGAELSQARIAFAKSQGLPVVTWDEIATQQFDLIYADQVFEHLAHPLITLQYLARALKPGGFLKIGVPDGGDIHRRLRVDDWTAPDGTRDSLNAVFPLEHINCFNRSALLAMGARAGLRPARIPLFLQYSHLILGGLSSEILKSLGRPLLRDVLLRGNYVLFTCP